MRWFIADTHFGHANILKYDNRPYCDIFQHDEDLIHRWNACVKDEDTIYHLGDFGFGPIEFLKGIYDRLKGKKILVRGNHDGSETRIQRLGWAFVCDGLFIAIRGSRFCLVHDPDEMDFHGFLVHGHTHRVSDRPDSISVSANIQNYQPVGENYIFKKLKCK